LLGRGAGRATTDNSFYPTPRLRIIAKSAPVPRTGPKKFLRCRVRFRPRTEISWQGPMFSPPAEGRSMSGLSYNLQMSKKAVAYVQQKLPRGSGNQSTSPSDGAACVKYTRSTMVCTADFIPELAERAKQTQCGNCGEQAAVAFMYLSGLGVRPIDYMNLYDP